LIWPAEALARAGHDVRVVPFKEDEPRFRVFYDAAGRPREALYPGDADVLVFQRVVEQGLVDFIRLVAGKGVAVVVDVDDDLSAIHPGNPAWAALHPNNPRNRDREAGRDISWQHLVAACRAATLVTATTDGLARQYAPHGRSVVIDNFLPESYFTVPPRQDSTVLGWGASYFSHPNDPQVTHGALARLVHEGREFRVWGDPEGAGRAFGLPADPEGTGPVHLLRWPDALSEIGVGIAPLADTRFNSKKSRLKVAELSACGVPWVASPRAEYAKLHKLGAGLLAGDKAKHWYAQLRRLLTDPIARADLSQAGQEVAAEYLRLEANASQWAEAWRAARELPERLPAPT
jgi:glycosyltransferase involved in cell wall biosynthesis